MAKKSKKISKAQQFQDLITGTITDLRNRLDAVRVEVERAWTLQNSREAIASKNRQELEKYAADTTASIYALRNSAQTAFSQIARDIERLQNSINDKDRRITSLEQQVNALRTAVLAAAENSLLGRLINLENKWNARESALTKKTKGKKKK